MTIFHPVLSNARVAIPSHFKRFSLKMFTFTEGDEVLKDQVSLNELYIGRSTLKSCESS